MNRGFTLIELVLTLSLLGLVALAAGFVISPALDSWNTTGLRQDAVTTASSALSRMVSEIAEIRDQQAVVEATAGRFQFVDGANQAITYSLNGTQLMRNGALLARGIQALTFSYEGIANNPLANPQVAPAATDIWKVGIQLVCLKEGQTVTIRSRVRPRNFVRS